MEFFRAFYCSDEWVYLVSMIIRLPEEFDDPSFSTVTIQRDLFYGYDTLMENVSDPSHIDFAHHKVLSLRIDGIGCDFMP